MEITRKVVGKIICAIIMVSLIIPTTLFAGKAVNVWADDYTMEATIKSRKNTSNKAVIVVETGSSISKIYGDTNYTDEKGNWKSAPKITFKKIKEGVFQADYTVKEGKYGEYELYLYGEDAEGNFAPESEATVIFRYESPVTRYSVAKAPGDPILIMDIEYTNNFWDIDKGSGNSERVVKNGDTVTVSVLYEKQGNKKTEKSDFYLMWGSKKISCSNFEKQAGTSYVGAKFVINTSGDSSGALVAYCIDEDEDVSSKSLGVTLICDGTAPTVQIDKSYTGGKEKYTNKDTSVPVTINEANFDSKNTQVKINGSEASVSWSTSGSQTRGNVNLREGKNEISIVATDKAGNKSKEAKSSIIYVDRTSPEVKIEGFGNGTGKGLVDGKEIAYPFKVTVTDGVKLGNNNVQLFRVLEDGVSKEPIELQVTENGNAIEYYIADLTEDGYYILEASIKDMAGNNVAQKSVKSEGKTPYDVSKGKISGAFTVNRKGSLYKAEDESIFTVPLKEAKDIVIYEYNKNEITAQQVTIVDSVSSRVLTANDYRFEKIESSDNPEYRYQYKYTIYSGNFREGVYNVEINSESMAGQTGVLIARTIESSSLNRQIIVDTTSPEVVMFKGTTSGEIEVRVRDNNMDISSAKIVIGNREYKLEYDETNSTSTNIVFTGNISRNPESATFVCSDLAGNEAASDEVEIERSSVLVTILIYVGLAAVVIALIVGAIIMIAGIRKKK